MKVDIAQGIISVGQFQRPEFLCLGNSQSQLQ